MNKQPVDLEPYSQLLEHLNKTIALSQVSGLISWDQEAMMPPEGTEARAEQSAAMAGVIHQLNCDPRISQWCDQLSGEHLNDVQLANVREARRSHERATKIPLKLAEEMARLSALGQGIWAGARRNENVSEFLPTLEEIVALKREEAACLVVNNSELYDALLDDFEPGMKTDTLVQLLGKLRPGLIKLREKIDDKGLKPKKITGDFSPTRQLEMAKRLATVFNYRWEAGRLDKSVHPFSSGYRSDSRITTRVVEDNVFDCMYSTIHEVGHANYEQGRDATMDRTPAGGYASMGVHESQSRMLENQIGRSRAFMDWLYPQMREVFGDIGLRDADELFASVNEVKSGYIRTEADEVHYNIHILMRFDLELALIRNELQVADLEGAWNDRFAADFGRNVDKPSNGLLQDVHWSCGLFGYFPTYSLGNIYAGELFSAMRDSIHDMDDRISRGEMGAMSDWLGNNVHQLGHVYPAPELMQKACHKAPDEKALLAYLNEKFM